LRIMSSHMHDGRGLVIPLDVQRSVNKKPPCLLARPAVSNGKARPFLPWRRNGF
jgi:hypothetical protein